MTELTCCVSLWGSAQSRVAHPYDGGALCRAARIGKFVHWVKTNPHYLGALIIEAVRPSSPREVKRLQFEPSPQEAMLENRVTRTRVLTDCSPTRLINAHLAFVSEKKHENRLTIDKRLL